MSSLREIVKGLAPESGKTMPTKHFVRLGSIPELRSGVTIDMDTSGELGTPFLVLHSPKQGDEDSRLTPRETEVARLIGQGLSNKEIAARLSLATSTVKDHVHNILEKTESSNRAAIAARFGRFD